MEPQIVIEILEPSPGDTILAEPPGLAAGFK